MKLSQSLVFTSILISRACSFAPVSYPRASRFETQRFVATDVTTETDSSSKEEAFDTDVPEEQIIARIGITEEELAIGVNAADFLKYAGTYV